MHTFLAFLRFSFLLVFLSLSMQSQAQKPVVPDLEEVENYIEKARLDWNVPGAAIGIIKNDTVLFARGFGTIRSDSKKEVDANTLFGIASNTKAFTSAGIAMLVDEGKLNWDDPVKNYLPYFELYDPYVSNAMTVRDLLCHRTGLKTFSGDLLWYGTTYSREEIVRKARHLEPTYGFRSHYGYSNIMFLAAGLIIEEVSGMGYDEFIAERFFEPLGMDRSNTSVKALENEDNFASPHIEYKNEMYPIEYVNWDNIAPAGAINSCVNDMMKWIQLQLHRGNLNGDTLFSADVSREMWSSQTVEGISKWEEGMFPSTHFRTYGLGWELFNYHGRKIVTHNGGLDGMITQVIMVPEENLGFVILTNNASTLTYVLMNYLMDVFLDTFKTDYSELFLGYKKEAEAYRKNKRSEEEEARVKNTRPSFDLKSYEGTYTDKMYGDITIQLQDGKLNLNFVPAYVFEGTLSHWHFDIFKLNWNKPSSLPPGNVQFYMDADGKIEKVKVDVPNPDFDFTEFVFYKQD